VSSNGWITFRSITVQAMARGALMRNPRRSIEHVWISLIASIKRAAAFGPNGTPYAYFRRDGTVHLSLYCRKSAPINTRQQIANEVDKEDEFTNSI
jgi:hypothetical protein